MVNTLINFTTNNHVSGSILHFNILPGIFFMFILALITFNLTASTSIVFVLSSFISVTFTLIIYFLINFISVKPVLIDSDSIIPAVVDSLKTVF
jgi:hypothetical protein